MRHRVSRAPHRDGNHSRVKAYSAELDDLFTAWLARVEDHGYSTASLVAQLDAAAQQAFPPAFAQGRHQAYPKRRPSGDGEQVLRAKLLSNRFYLQHSLALDIESRVAKWRMDPVGTLPDALRKSFQSRVRDGYGGAVWSAQEAGYRAGVAEAKRDLAIRLTGHLMAEEGDDEEPGDPALAIALGLTVVGLLLLVSSFRSRVATAAPTSSAQLMPLAGTLEAAQVQVGTEYHAEDDDATCDECQANADGGDSGVYWDEGDVPLPGEDCAGRTNCRCWLETITEIP